MALTLTLGIASLANMEVKFDPQLQEKLKRTAAQQGRASESLVAEAVERMLSYDEWFVAKVEKGMAAADCGGLVDSSEIRKMIDRRYPPDTAVSTTEVGTFLVFAGYPM
jgi:predicted transcriptional regulator